jgi:hypothetical protein
MSNDLPWLDFELCQVSNETFPQLVGVQAFLRFDVCDFFRKHSYRCFVCSKEETNVLPVYANNAMY